jgi:hypothetical protein
MPGEVDVAMTGFSTDSKKKGPGKGRSSAVSGRPGNPLLAAAIAAMLLLVAVVGLSSQSPSRPARMDTRRAVT